MDCKQHMIRQAGAGWQPVHLAAQPGAADVHAASLYLDCYIPKQGCTPPSIPAAHDSLIMVQDGSLSTWLRNPGLLTYTLLGLHPLVPPPSRINNNVVLSILACAACPWAPEPPSSSADVVLGPPGGRTPLARLQGSFHLEVVL